MESMELDLRQRDALGEMSNISMGSSATALSALLMNRRVEITTPQVEVIRRSPVDVESVKIFEKLFASSKKDMVKVTFKLKVSDFIDTSMVQLYPIELAKQLVDYFCER